MQDWNVTRAKLKEKISKLNVDDVAAMEGEQEELVGRLEKRLRKTRAAILKFLGELNHSFCTRPEL